jgi:hypothetical protein
MDTPADNPNNTDTPAASSSSSIDYKANSFFIFKTLQLTSDQVAKVEKRLVKMKDIELIDRGSFLQWHESLVFVKTLQQTILANHEQLVKYSKLNDEKMSAATKQLHLAQRKISELTEEVKAKENDLARFDKQVEATVAKFEQENDQLVTEKAALTLELRQQIERITDMIGALGEATKRAEDLFDQLEDYKATISKLTTENKQLVHMMTRMVPLCANSGSCNKVRKSCVHLAPENGGPDASYHDFCSLACAVATASAPYVTNPEWLKQHGACFDDAPPPPAEKQVHFEERDDDCIVVEVGEKHINTNKRKLQKELGISPVDVSFSAKTGILPGKKVKTAAQISKFLKTMSQEQQESFRKTSNHKYDDYLPASDDEETK